MTVTLHVAAGERRERTGTVTGAFADRPVGDRREVDGARLAAGVDPQLRRHRVPAVGDDLQVEVVERSRAAGCATSTHCPTGVTERGAPRGGGIAVERRRAARRDVAREVLRRAHGDAAVRRVRDARAASSSTSSGAAVARRAVPAPPKVRVSGTRSGGPAPPRPASTAAGRRPCATGSSRTRAGGRRRGARRRRRGRSACARSRRRARRSRPGRVVAQADLGEADVVACTAQSTVVTDVGVGDARSRVGGTCASGT